MQLGRVVADVSVSAEDLDRAVRDAKRDSRRLILSQACEAAVLEAPIQRRGRLPDQESMAMSASMNAIA
jgi:hypothetical protein